MLVMYKYSFHLDKTVFLIPVLLDYLQPPSSQEDERGERLKIFKNYSIVVYASSEHYAVYILYHLNYRMINMPTIIFFHLEMNSPTFRK